MKADMDAALLLQAIEFRLLGLGTGIEKEQLVPSQPETNRPPNRMRGVVRGKILMTPPRHHATINQKLMNTPLERALHAPWQHVCGGVPAPWSFPCLHHGAITQTTPSQSWRPPSCSSYELTTADECSYVLSRLFVADLLSALIYVMWEVNGHINQLTNQSHSFVNFEPIGHSLEHGHDHTK